MSKNQEETLFSENEYDLYTLIHDIVVNWWVVLIGALAVSMLSSFWVSFRYEPKYMTETTFVVVAKNKSGAYSNLSTAYTMATTFKQVLDSTVLQKTVCESLGMETLDADIEASVMDGTNLMTLRVTADNPKDAIDIIQAIMDNYSSVSLYTVGNAVMEVLQQPSIPYTPTNPLNVSDMRKKGFLGGALAVILILGAFSVMKNTVKQEKEVERKLDARSLGEISYEWKYKTIRDLVKHKKKAALVDDPVSGFSFVESYKKLAARVQYQMSKDKRKVLVVTSAAENEGKSTVAVNLAITLAEQGKKIILIDGDIRKPSQHLILGISSEDKNEVAGYLRGENTLKDIVLPTGRENLRFLGGRKRVSSSTELLSTDKLEKMIEVCRKAADYVIIDTPPAGLIGDAQIFAEHADAVLVVVRQNYILAEDINDVMDDFRDHNHKVLGVVLNGVQKFSSLAETPVGHYYYGRYGQYRKYGAYNTGKKSKKKES